MYKVAAYQAALLGFGGRYTAVSQDNRAVPGMYGSQLDTTGARIPGGPIYLRPHNSSGWPPTVASNTLALMLSGCSSGGGTVAAQRLNTSLAVLDPTAISTGLSGLCRAGSNGTDFLVIAGYTNLDGRFFTAAGALVAWISCVQNWSAPAKPPAGGAPAQPQ